MRPVNNMIEFKQIIGRGTRLFEDKFYFTVVDFVGASANFADPEWDGEPIPEEPPEINQVMMTLLNHQSLQEMMKLTHLHQEKK
jgi:type I site-specific restriction endonuclease